MYMADGDVLDQPVCKYCGENIESWTSTHCAKCETVDPYGIAK